VQIAASCDINKKLKPAESKLLDSILGSLKEHGKGTFEGVQQGRQVAITGLVKKAGASKRKRRP
jgi:hypothetical protein